MKNHARSIEKAVGYFRSADSLGPKGRIAAARDLSGDGCWSIAQIGAILKVTASAAYGWGLKKGDRTGGRFVADTLPLLLELAELAELGRPDGRLEALAVEAGTSPVVIARLTGEYEIDVRRRVRRANSELTQAGVTTMAEFIGFEGLGKFGLARRFGADAGDAA